MLDLPRNTTLYSLGKTNTFRAASSALFKSPWFQQGFGCNLQNIPKKLRAMYPADKGYKLGQADQRGAEALIVAYLCRPGKYRDLFIYSISPHSYVALHLFKEKWKVKRPDFDIDGICLLEPRDLKQHEQYKSIMSFIKSSDNWAASERYYFMAKQTSHSSNYGIKAPTFRMNTLEKSDGLVVLSQKEAEYFLAFYRSTFPEIPAWNYETMLLVSKTRQLFNLFGHPRYFSGEQDDEYFRGSYAFVPQSTVGEITHMAFRDMQAFIEDNNRDWHLLNNDHDSYLMEFPVEEEKEAATKMQLFMERDLVSPNGDKFKMASEVKTGFNWGEFDSKKNPLGLQELH